MQSVLGADCAVTAVVGEKCTAWNGTQNEENYYERNGNKILLINFNLLGGIT